MPSRPRVSAPPAAAVCARPAEAVPSDANSAIDARLPEDLPDHADVLAAAQRINGLVKCTPVLGSDALNRLAGAELHFKCENLQIGGAFKLRGASNAVALLGDGAAAGVCTHSSGNHGAALARAARAQDIACTVVVPEGTNARKLANMRDQGAQLIRCAPTQQAREQTLARHQRETGATPIHPYDDSAVIAGQGTAALELLDQEPDLQALLVPVGGGGLVAGTLLATDGRLPVWGSEPAGADDAARSLSSGQRVTEQTPDTLCDGLRSTIGRRNFALIRAHAAGILTISDRQVVEAMRLLWDELKLVVEPSAATGLAAVLAHAENFRGRRLGIILTGGNVDLEQLPW